MSDRTGIWNLEAEKKELLAETANVLRQKTTGSSSEKEEPEADGFRRSAGSWNGLVDPEALTEIIYTSRKT